MRETAGASQPAATAPKHSWFVRSIYAGHDLEVFLVTAIATILIVRAALAATGWPQLGGGKIHFAHLLWGGLGMLIALILFMAMQGRLWKQLATVSAGIGFGLFIDELGKFITSDNDYFFQPAVAIIYLVFVALFLIVHVIVGRARLSPQAALANAFDLAKEAVMRGLDQADRDEALRLLRRCDQDDPIVRDLRQMLAQMGELPQGPPQPYERLKRWLTGFYDSLVRRPWFKALIVGWYVVVALVALVNPFVTGSGFDAGSFAETGQLVSAFAVGAFVALGVLRWPRSRLAAYRWFERAMLVTIFIYEFFAFYQNQLTAVFGLVIILITYATIRLMIGQEEAREESNLAGAAEAAA